MILKLQFEFPLLKNIFVTNRLKYKMGSDTRQVIVWRFGLGMTIGFLTMPD